MLGCLRFVSVSVKRRRRMVGGCDGTRLFHTKRMLRVSGLPCPLQRHSFDHPGSHLLIVHLPKNSSVGKPTDEENTFAVQSHLHKFTI